LSPHQHEGKIVTYGFISVSFFKEITKSKIVHSADMVINNAREIADGKSIFVIVEDGRYSGILILAEPRETEYSLVAFQQEVNGVVCVTDKSGTTRFFHKNGISIHEFRQWRFKPNIASAVSQIHKIAPMVSYKDLSMILKFCFYSLSVDKIGATIVWFIRQPSEALLAATKPRINTQLLQMNIIHSLNLWAFQSLLERNDGAALMLQNGEIFGIGAHLQSSQKSQELLPAYSGTRHTSARRFSYDCSESLVFTVSADGPVSVFSDGLKVTEIDSLDYNHIANFYRNLKIELEDNSNDVDKNEWEEVCPKCGKTSIVHEIFIYGWRERETVSCPVCNTEIASRKCYQLDSQLVKRFT
jgi:DNA integrity scanning protein DisA with diadenylate cyclase activity